MTAAENRANPLYKAILRHSLARLGRWILIALGLAAVVFLLYAEALPALDQVSGRDRPLPKFAAVLGRALALLPLVWLVATLVFILVGCVKTLGLALRWAAGRPPVGVYRSGSVGASGDTAALLFVAPDGDIRECTGNEGGLFGDLSGGGADSGSDGGGDGGGGDGGGGD